VAREVVWAGRARSDARLALEYIQKDSPEAARRFASALVTAARSLAELYEVFPDRVAIVRIIHASRDFLAAWGRRTPA
jgi:plasmid stabilization system protein ParE